MKNKSVFLGRISMILAKLIEVSFWIAAVGLLVAFIMALFFPGQIANGNLASLSQPQEELTVLGLSAGMISYDSLAHALCFLCPFGCISASLYAMIFRNIYLILRKVNASDGRAFSSDNSPFQPDIIRMVREIGIFSILIPLTTLIGQVILRLFLPESNGNFDILQLVSGLAILYLSTIFQYGGHLQAEMDEVI